MIHKPFDTCFKNPNFRCVVEDNRGEKYIWITYAESKDVLRNRLEKDDFTNIQITNYDFNIWIEKAKKATKEAIESYVNNKVHKFKSDVWTELKLHLFELFNGKCAYCESKVLHVSSGDIEHYRPKRKVEEDPNHPGYYWLAYDIHNLFPVCEKCNRARAKMNHFPVKGFRAYSPNDDLEKEEPLLLSPYNDDEIKKHLSFPPRKEGTYTGEIKSTSKKGECTIKHCNLGRCTLNDERQHAQEDIIMKLKLHIINNREKLKEIWRKIHNGQWEYSAAVKSQADFWFEELKVDLP